MQIITDFVVIWWMVIALYQFFDFLIDELIFSENYFKSAPRVVRALVMLPTFPVMTIFSSILGAIVKVRIDEAVEQED